jgi:hypothetical protein
MDEMKDLQEIEEAWKAHDLGILNATHDETRLLRQGFHGGYRAGKSAGKVQGFWSGRVSKLGEPKPQPLADTAYPGNGSLGEAVRDLKKLVCTSVGDKLPRYWREFSRQLYADVIALEAELLELRAELGEKTDRKKKS